MRRRPTHIVEPRPTPAGHTSAAGAAGRLPANLPALSEQWVRDLCPPDAEQRAETLKRWRIATGQDSGNPEQTAGRSKVQRHQPNPQTPAQWRKEYQHNFGVYERHELLVLVQLWSAPAQDQRSPRDFHAQAVMLGDETGAPAAAGPSRLQRLVTKDAGPNLLSWEYFQPLTLVGPQQLAWPLFAHPLFLAAITHRLLVATEVLFAHKVVHLDLKPENIGLALPTWQPSLQPTGNPTRLEGQWPLKALPLKLLDFEFSVHHSLSYPGMPPSNDYTSPFARQRLAVAAAHENQSNAWAQAVDWGADLYALGHMLADWVAWGQTFHEAYVVKQRNELGPHVQGAHLGALCQTQWDDLVWLERFARKLQAQDRPADEALVTQPNLASRPATPLAHLRAELAGRFAALQDGARGLDLPFFMHLPNGAVRAAAPKPEAPKPVQPKSPTPPKPEAPKPPTPPAAPKPEAPKRKQPPQDATVPSKPSSGLFAATAAVTLAVAAGAWHWRADLPELLRSVLYKPQLAPPAAVDPTPVEPVALQPGPAVGSHFGDAIAPTPIEPIALQPTPNWQDLAELTVPGCSSSCPSFIVIPRVGPVTLGSGADALPVDIRHRYAMGKTEVTVGQWKAFWNAPDRDYNPVKTEDTRCNWNDKNYASDDRKPVVCVNVLDAEAYVRWINKKYAQAMGVRFDLPTEVEWELAARGGRYTQDYLWADGASDEEISRHAQWYKSPGNTVAVGSKLANGYGLYDMVGNVWEWQSSPWRDKRSELPRNGLEAQAAGVSVSRSVRGASFNDSGDRLRLAGRYRDTPGYRYYSIGFRLVARIASE
jgi:hypothetical protein